MRRLLRLFAPPGLLPRYLPLWHLQLFLFGIGSDFDCDFVLFVRVSVSILFGLFGVSAFVSVIVPLLRVLWPQSEILGSVVAFFS